MSCSQLLEIRNLGETIVFVVSKDFYMSLMSEIRNKKAIHIAVEKIRSTGEALTGRG